ncbi:DUF1176 domain-containing protein [Synechococcus sp. BDU 130192]|uniref:DUF1176 domain-containing protein n=1 Tax=Synechococcus sp. BDU 130192 TaxID=2042059 RepID=UPI000C074AAF|nr:DUF1176 domain-containing protein [Synechococcus sp. BDU 130192]
MRFKCIAFSTLISLGLGLGSCQNQSNPSAPEPDGTTPTDPTEEPIPVPAEPLPLVNSQGADTKEVEAVDQNYSSPDISQAIIPELMENREELGLCQEFRFESELTEAASNVYRVGEDEYLVHLVCGSTAYQLLQNYFLYRRDEDQFDLTPLPITYFYQDTDQQLIKETEVTRAGYSEYDPSSQTISIFTKGRGLGDCGSLGFYQFTGTDLSLNRFLLKDECDGNYIEPINYPQVYP